MTPAERGRIIKEARIAKKMTQSEVVGSFITRNMLSQIESGNATPSVKTLEYLSQTLDIPISELMPRGDEESCPESGADIYRLVRAKELLSGREYFDAIEAIGEENEWGALSDEFYAVLARCYLGLAEETADTDAVRAVEYARRAASLSEKGLYANPALKDEAVRLQSSLAERLSRYYAGLISDTP
ncbi:MAG: helix-turn-helix transcriptional regulator [Oscillospiraceae bacterium]|nr:helix-turn-helix transcriptional regulator [Oscillospiraceae bacterium]